MNWKNVPLQAELAVRVPTVPGLYAILRAPKVHGLPAEWEIGYVGKTINLRRRFGEHVTPWKERNQAMKASSIYRNPNWEFWYREWDATQLDRGERELIRRIRPVLNQIRYGDEPWL